MTRTDAVQAHTPTRVQRHRTKGWRLPANTVIVDRSSQFGNFTADWQQTGRAEAVRLFEEELMADTAYGRNYRAWYRDMLRGKNLACWCQLDQPCHADVLLKVANEAAPA